MYLRIINNTTHYPYSITELRNSYPNVSLPENISDESLIEWDMYVVQPTPMPTDYTKDITEGTPTLIDGIYYKSWMQTNASEEEINYRIQSKWEDIRILRSELLSECDWTQLSDIPTETKELWQTYRQSLRDITSQTNPFSITWPVKP
jgi:hypothetical protein